MAGCSQCTLTWRDQALHTPNRRNGTLLHLSQYMTTVVFGAKHSLASTFEANSLAALANDTPLRSTIGNLAALSFTLDLDLILIFYHKLLVIRVRIKSILYLAELRIRGPRHTALNERFVDANSYLNRTAVIG